MADLFNPSRLSPGSTAQKPGADSRTEFERDFDRILFSAPVRRLADKTQVFPMEKNDSVRTRLTHSHEVSNLCRSLATQIFRKDKSAFGDKEELGFAASTIAAAVGLAHDLGNPPFGHQGENAIRRWFASHLDAFSINGRFLSEAQQTDFLAWEGNAQALRLLTRLQVAKGTHGLDLTCATLAALMKYTVSSSNRGKGKRHPANKKFGFFQADRVTAENILTAVGLKFGQRHPIAYLMEACDDIAYSVIDIEDAIKKNLISINDVVVAIEGAGSNFAVLAKNIRDRISDLRQEGRPMSEINDIGSQYYRTYAIHEMIGSVVESYISNKNEILQGTFDESIISQPSCSKLCEQLKNFARDRAYNAPSVKEIELRGDVLLQGLMDYFWRGISECSVNAKRFPKLATRLNSPNATPFGEFVYSHVSRNYVACFESDLGDDTVPTEARYRQLLLLTDMVSGMTETFALDLFEKFDRSNDARKY